MYSYLSIYLSVLSAYLSIYLFICLSTFYLSAFYPAVSIILFEAIYRPSVYLSIYPSFHLSSSIAIYTDHLSICLFIYLSTSLPFCTSISLSL